MGTLKGFPVSYAYVQFSRDPDIQALIAAQNAYQQGMITRQEALNLPIYTQLVGPVAPSLLDWVALGLYGMLRPVFVYSSGGTGKAAVYDSGEYDSFTYDGGLGAGGSSFEYQLATDDQFKRCITWNFYKGDGFQFNSRWLKRRVERFLAGANGIDPGVALNGWPNIDNTYKVSIAYTAGVITITPDPSFGALIPILQQALAGGFLNVPIEYEFVVA